MSIGRQVSDFMESGGRGAGDHNSARAVGKPAFREPRRIRAQPGGASVLEFVARSASVPVHAVSKANQLACLREA